MLSSQFAGLSGVDDCGSVHAAVSESSRLLRPRFAREDLDGCRVDSVDVPPDRVGLWVASGHAFVTEAAPKARIEILREKWRKATKNQLLRTEREPKKPARGGRGHGNV